MLFNYSKLEGKIKEICKTHANFAKEMGLSEKSISSKLNNKKGWKQKEMLRACEVLEINLNDIPLFFYCISSTH